MGTGSVDPTRAIHRQLLLVTPRHGVDGKELVVYDEIGVDVLLAGRVPRPVPHWFGLAWFM